MPSECTATSETSLPNLAVTIAAACELVSVSRTTMYREIASGRIRAVKARGRTLILVDSLKAWLTALPSAANIRGKTEEP